MNESATKQHPTRVSVIVPTYNRAKFIGESLDAILAQLHTQDEVIVVNDGSQDDTADVLSAYTDRLRVVTQENAGKSAALNRALPDVSGDLVWIVDDDDIVSSDARDRLVSALESAPEAGFAYGRHDRFFDDENTGSRHTLDTGYWYESSPAEFLCATLEDFFAHQPGMMVRKEIYEHVGPFTPIYSEDYDMLIRLALVAQPVAVPGILFHQRQHDGTRGTAADPIRIDQRDTAWIKASRDIVTKYMDELPLQMFVPERALIDGLTRRRARIQRGVIFARHGLWVRSVEEFELAAEEALDALMPAERELLRRVSGSKFGTQTFLSDRDAQRAFTRLAASSAIGRSIVRRIGKSFAWRARTAVQNGRYATALQYAQRVIDMWILGR
ncbi:MAG: glycosyltransferase [Pseudomonadota bacterium]